MVDSQTACLGLFGFPVKHSLSPRIHRYFSKLHRINATYLCFEVSPAHLEKAITGAKALGLKGFNLTIPHKESIIRYLDCIDPGARLIGAVNTVKIENGKTFGFNTDGEGFLRHLQEELSFDPRHKDIAMLGAGGAARAVSVYLAKMHPASLAIYDIDKAKAKALLGHLKANFKHTTFRFASSVIALDIAQCDLLVNTTPVGMKPGDPCLVAPELLHKKLFVYDLIYNPGETKLLMRSRLHGCRISNGLGMLLHQAARSFEIWTGKKIAKSSIQKLQSAI
ncbi:MAG: shikimate dehydrogenase [Candidatus Omnitrophota bacterium]